MLKESMCVYCKNPGRSSDLIKMCPCELNKPVHRSCIIDYINWKIERGTKFQAPFHCDYCNNKLFLELVYETRYCLRLLYFVVTMTFSFFVFLVSIHFFGLICCLIVFDICIPYAEYDLPSSFLLYGFEITFLVQSMFFFLLMYYDDNLRKFIINGRSPCKQGIVLSFCCLFIFLVYPCFISYKKTKKRVVDIVYLNPVNNRSLNELEIV